MLSGRCLDVKGDRDGHPPRLGRARLGTAKREPIATSWESQLLRADRSQGHVETIDSGGSRATGGGIGGPE